MKKIYVLIILIGTLIFQNSIAIESSVYPGLYEATIKNVRATNKIELAINVWAGYQRQLLITLPHIDIPKHYEDAPDCHFKLIHDGLKFTKNKINRAQKIEVSNIKMEDSTTSLGSAEIYLDKLKLSKQLIQNNYARADSIAKNNVWCTDEK